MYVNPTYLWTLLDTFWIQFFYKKKIAHGKLCVHLVHGYLYYGR